MGHGTGNAVCSNAGTWGVCSLISCDAGFALDESSCVAAECDNGAWAQPCSSSSDHGVGFQTCDHATRRPGACLLTSCDAGFHYSSGGCYHLAIAADLPFVALGGNATLSWDVPDATTCHVMADGLSLWNGTSETVNTAALHGPSTTDTVFTLECDMRDGTTQTGLVTVRVPVQTQASDCTFAAMRGANIMDESSTSAIAWFSNTPQLAPIAKRMNVNFVRLNMDLSQAIDEGFTSGGENDFLETLQTSLDALGKQNIKAILVFGIEPSTQYRSDALCRCPSNVSFVYVRPLAQKIVTAFGSHPALYSFELMNEAYSTMGDGNKCDHAGIRQFVVGMYKLVRTLAPSVPTSVVRQPRTSLSCLRWLPIS